MRSSFDRTMDLDDRTAEPVAVIHQHLAKEFVDASSLSSMADARADAVRLFDRHVYNQVDRAQGSMSSTDPFSRLASEQQLGVRFLNGVVAHKLPLQFVEERRFADRV